MLKILLANTLKEDWSEELNFLEWYFPSSKTQGMRWIPKNHKALRNIIWSHGLVSPYIILVLGEIATWFARHELLSPYIMKGKKLLQDIWLIGHNKYEALGRI